MIGVGVYKVGLEPSVSLQNESGVRFAGALKLRAMIRSGDVTLGSHVFSEVIGISDNLLDLLNYSASPQSTTENTVDEGDQSHEADD